MFTGEMSSVKNTIYYNFWSKPWLVAAAIILVEALSFIGFYFPYWEIFFFGSICTAVFVLAIKDLRWGLLAVLTELFIGGFGYLFFLPLGDFKLSLRMGLFVAVLLATAVKMARERRVAVLRSRFLKPYLWLVGFLALGVVLGRYYGQTTANMLVDTNAWLFLGYLVAFYQADWDFPNDYQLLCTIFMAAVGWLAIKTLAVFFIFTHGFVDFVPILYKWIRDTRIGEITPAGNGFYRVFFQSQIYAVLGLVLLLAEKLLRGREYLFFLPKGRCAPQVSAAKNKYSRPLLLAVLFSATAFLSFSRSFWIGLTLTVALTFSSAFIRWRISGKEVLKTFGWLATAGVGGLLLILLISYFPYPQRGQFNLAEVMGGRLTAGDAAAATRWAELQPLWSSIKKHWFLGSGFGTTVTFFSQDPRILQMSPTGQYTTYAFEWGWLDLWLKVGLFGVLAYLNLLWQIFKQGWWNIKQQLKKETDNTAWLPFGLLMSLVALAVIHIFTPYLNHPLGLGWLIIAGILIEKK